MGSKPRQDVQGSLHSLTKCLWQEPTSKGDALHWLYIIGGTLVNVAQDHQVYHYYQVLVHLQAMQQSRS